MSSIKTVIVSALFQKMKEEKIRLIDVRTAEEFQHLHIQGAQNYPLQSTDWNLFSQQMNAEKAYYFICARGARSERACDVLQHFDATNVYNVIGGTTAWFQEGFPVVKKTNP